MAFSPAGIEVVSWDVVRVASIWVALVGIRAKLGMVSY